MNAQTQAFPRSVSIDGDRLESALASSRSKYILAQAFMVTGYLALIVNPFEGNGMMIGLACQCIALLVYCWSKQAADQAGDEAVTKTIR